MLPGTLDTKGEYAYLRDRVTDEDVDAVVDAEVPGEPLIEREVTRQEAAHKVDSDINEPAVAIAERLHEHVTGMTR